MAPEMKRFNDVAAGRVAKESRMKGWGYDAYRRELKRQVGCSVSIQISPFLPTPIQYTSVSTNTDVALTSTIRFRFFRSQCVFIQLILIANLSVPST